MTLISFYIVGLTCDWHAIIVVKAVFWRKKCASVALVIHADAKVPFAAQVCSITTFFQRFCKC